MVYFTKFPIRSEVDIRSPASLHAAQNAYPQRPAATSKRATAADALQQINGRAKKRIAAARRRIGTLRSGDFGEIRPWI